MVVTIYKIWTFRKDSPVLGAVVKGVLRTALMSLTADSAVVFIEVVATTGGMGGTGRGPPEAIPPPLTGFGVIEVGPELVALGLGYLALPLLYWAPCKPWKVIESRGLRPPGIPTLA